MMITRKYHPVASFAQALPVEVTVAVNFVQFDSRNPAIRMRAPFNKLRIDRDTFNGAPVVKVIGETSTDLWWEVTLNATDGGELVELIAEMREAVKSL